MPTRSELELAERVLQQAQGADWAPISVDGKLHDRASFRYFWQVLERANQTGCELPESMQEFFPARIH